MDRIDLYSADDVTVAKGEQKKRLIAFFALCAVALAMLVFTLIWRFEIPGLAATALLSCVSFCFYSIKVSPYVKYNRFLREMSEGLSRETEGRFASISDSVRTVDGVEVSDFIVRVESDEMDERLFLWDVDKTCPEIQEGCAIRVTSHSNFVKSVELF